MTLLTPAQASEIVGVPEVQLRRWAYLGLGPKNSGTKHKPMFDQDDLLAWEPKIIVRGDKITIRGDWGDCGIEHSSMHEWQKCPTCKAIQNRRLNGVA